MTASLEMGEGSASRPGRSLPPEMTRYPFYRRLCGPQSRSEQVRKIPPPPGFDPRAAQSVASRYIDYATLPTLYKVLPTYFGPLRSHYENIEIITSISYKGDKVGDKLQTVRGHSLI